MCVHVYVSIHLYVRLSICLCPDLVVLLCLSPNSRSIHAYRCTSVSLSLSLTLFRPLGSFVSTHAQDWSLTSPSGSQASLLKALRGRPASRAILNCRSLNFRPSEGLGGELKQRGVHGGDPIHRAPYPQ